MVMSQVSTPMKFRLADPSLRREVETAVRRRIRGEDAEDVVQATLTDVLGAARVPEDPEEFRRFVFGVARHKVYDHFRRQKRATEAFDESETPGAEQPLSERDILRWAEGELPDSESKSTLEWMLREGDGEKLEHIARDAQLPAPRVRQRVSRLRKLLRQRWATELLLAGSMVLLAACGVLYWFARNRNAHDVVEREPARPLPSNGLSPPPSRPAISSEPEATPAPSSAPVPSSLNSPKAQPKTKAKTLPTSKPRRPSQKLQSPDFSSEKKK